MESLNRKSNREKANHFFLIICFTGAVAIFSSTMSKNPVLNPFAESLGTPDAFLGVVAAASTVPGVLISLPAGSMSDIFGKGKMLVVASTIFFSAPFFYIFIDSWWQLMLVRFYHGFATAIFVPVARAIIAHSYQSRRGEKISTFTSATIVGRGIAPFLGGFILSSTLSNYSTLYFIVGLAGMTTFFTTLLLIRGRSIKRVNVNRNQNKIKGYGWREVIGNHKILVVSSTEAAVRYVYGALEFFLVGYLIHVVHMDPALVGIIMGAQLILIPVASPFLGRLSDQVGRNIPIFVGLLLGGVPLIAIPFMNQFLPFLMISLTFGFGFSLVISSTPALVGDLTRKECYGTAMGFLATIMDVGQLLGPVITGVIIATFGYSGSFFSLGAILLVFGIFFGACKKLFS